MLFCHRYTTDLTGKRCFGFTAAPDPSWTPASCKQQVFSSAHLASAHLPTAQLASAHLASAAPPYGPTRFCPPCFCPPPYCPTRFPPCPPRFCTLCSARPVMHLTCRGVTLLSRSAAGGLMSARHGSTVTPRAAGSAARTRAGIARMRRVGLVLLRMSPRDSRARLLL